MHIYTQTQGKKEHLPLLLLADPEERMVDRYLYSGTLHVMEDGGKTVCVAVMLPVGKDCVELKNLATREDEQGKGYGSAMLRALFAEYGTRFDTMLVGTSESMVPFYERFGFRYSHTVKNFFVEHYHSPIYENGVLCADMVYLQKHLPAISLG